MVIGKRHALQQRKVDVDVEPLGLEIRRSDP